jgi:RNA polymerase sigma factor (sigma-70 family)
MAGDPNQEASDQDLLRRFAEENDDAAFTVLVQRHSRMVMGVGLRVLRCHQKAEDVCQATFLLLAKKARNAAWRDSAANWLYGVAFNLALNARSAERRRTAYEAAVPAKPAPDALAEVTVRELQEILDEEIARLPGKYRGPVVLCCLEGKTRDEAALSLGVSVAVVKGRLEEGRERLRRQLIRRGVQFSVALAGFTLSGVARAAGLSAKGVQAVTQAALGVANGGGIAGDARPEVATLFNQGVRTMFLTKLKLTLAVVFAACLVAAGAVTVGQAAPTDKPVTADKPSEQPKPPFTAAQPQKKTFTKTGTIHNLSETTFNLENLNGTTAFGGRGLTLGGLIVDKGTKVTIGGKSAQLKDLVNGMPVVIHREEVGGPVVLIEAEYVEYRYDVKAVDAEKKTLSLTTAGAAGPVFDIAVKDDAKFAGAGKPTKLADIKPGARVALKLDDTGRVANSVRVLRDFEQ